MPITLPTQDLWEYLSEAAASGRSILLYGMGNGADKILAVCAARGIPVADFFASDGFVRGHSFHGRTVLSFAEACQRYDPETMIVLLSFASSRPEVLDIIARVAATVETYVPDVPVVGQELFDRAFFEANRESIRAARALLSDEESRRVYDGILSYKLTGQLDVLRSTESNPTEELAALLPAESFRTVLDLGAYNGDSIRALRPLAPQLSHVIAMEPDRRNHRKLKAYADGLASENDPLQVLCVEAGAWSSDTTLCFHDSGNRNAGLTDSPAASPASPLPSTADNPYFGKTREVCVRTPDSVVAEARASGALPVNASVDFIKYDVEGAETEALLGSREIIKTNAPALLVSAYHRSADLFRLPLLVHELDPAYRLYLRRAPGVPAWDINLFAVHDA